MVLTIALVTVQIFSSTVVATARQRAIHRENAAAIGAARTALEVLRDEPFGNVFALYNADPGDDPGGPGTAPGANFPVPRLERAARAGTVPLGEIVFPALGKKGGKLGKLLGGGDAEGKQELREDYEDRAIGMPRDLNGDGKIDKKDHAEDYVMLPVLVRVTWVGVAGPREVELHSILTDYRW